jgi:ribosomal protein S18 acetylase RimI-like enzyme
MNIRVAKKRDLEEIYQIYLDFQDSEDRNSKEISKDYFTKLRKRKNNFKKVSNKSLLKSISDKKGRFLVALDNNVVVGYAFGEIGSSNKKKKDKKSKSKEDPFSSPKTGWISIMAVKKGHRGKGIGTKLHNELKKWFKSKKCSYMELMVMNSNKAIKLYKKLGYRPTYIKMNKKI